MYFQLGAPHSLQGLVVCFWQLTAETYPSFEDRLLPDTCSEVIINLSQPFVRTTSNGLIHESKLINTIGTRGTYNLVKQGTSVSLFGIRFTPLGLFALTGLPQSALDNGIISENKSSWIPHGLVERLYEEGSLSGRAKIVEAFLLQKEAPSYLRRILWISEAFKLINSNTIRSVDDISKTYWLHYKKVERDFYFCTGYSPKYFLRIQRFKNVVKALYAGCSFSDIAYSQGYTDQAHLNKEFKSFCGISPTLFLKEKANISQMTFTP